jgi:KipI family sensor histidine kinase inhibitor
MRMRVLPAGPYGVLLEEEDAGDAARCFTVVQRLRGRFGSIVDVVPAERTVLVISTFDESGRRALRDVVGAVAGAAVGGEPRGGGTSDAPPMVELAVRYDGPDLAEVAELTGLDEAQVIALHSGAEYVVGFTGFAPGFAYLTGLPAALNVPRRTAPRTRVETGSVGIAGSYSGVYPRESPGGWQLLGRLADEGVALWDPAREEPALLLPGTRVRFRAVSGGVGGSVGHHGGAEPLSSGQASAGLRIVRAGLLTTVQDLGRPGYAHLGVPRSGAADPKALRLANRLVGNPEDAAGLETTLTGCAVTLTSARWVAVAGARAEVTVTADGRSTVFGSGVAFYVPGGGQVDIGSAAAGVRSYLAVAGGLDAPRVLGSRSADVLSGIGYERPLKADCLLPLGRPTALPPDIPGLGLAPHRDPADPAVLRLVPGPRDAWFDESALATLGEARYLVTMESNRTALRLDGLLLHRRDPGRELVSEGMVPGALQVPPDGRPVLFLADHPVTGGYPVIGCVHPADLPAVAQARPGSAVRFRIVGDSP